MSECTDCANGVMMQRTPLFASSWLALYLALRNHFAGTGVACDAGQKTADGRCEQETR